MNKKYVLLAVSISVVFISCVSPSSYKSTIGESSPKRVLAPLWEKTLVSNVRFSDTPQQFATPFLTKDLIYIGDSSGFAYCIDFSGRILWKTKLSSSVHSTPLFIKDKNLVVIGTIGGKLFGLNAKTGKIKWQFKGFGGFLGIPVYKEGVIYVTTSKNMLYAVTADNGLLHWSKRHETFIGYTVKGHSSPIIDNNIIYTGLSDGRIVAMNLQNRGSVIWSKNLNLSQKENYIDADSTPVILAHRIFMSSYRSGIFALDKSTGEILWRFPAYGVKNILVANDKIYFVSATTGIHCISTEGRLVWRQNVNLGSAGQSVVIGKRLFIPFDEGGMIVLNSDNGYFYQRFATGSGISANPAYYKRYMAVLSNNGKLYFFDIK